MRFHFPEVPLLDGTYSVSVGVRSATETAIYDWKDQVTKFEVANPASVDRSGAAHPST